MATINWYNCGVTIVPVWWDGHYSGLKEAAQLANHYVIYILLTCLSLASCSNSETECSVAADTMAIIDHLSDDDKTYYLVYRLSGWHDKIESFELYGAKPTFDNCGTSAIEPLFGTSIDDKDSDNNDQYVVHIYFEPPEKFILDYAPGAQPTPDHYKNLTLERRKM